MLSKVKGWIAELTDIAVALIALGVALGVVFGSQVTFVDGVLNNLVGVINDIGNAGVAGIIVLAILAGMYGNRSM